MAVHGDKEFHDFEQGLKDLEKALRRGKLKPCPHCGSNEVEGPFATDNTTPYWWIECENCNCGMEGACHESKQSLIDNWNLRTFAVDDDVCVESESKSDPMQEKLGAPQGWICPICGKGLAPFTPSCSCTDKLPESTPLDGLIRQRPYQMQGDLC